MKNIQEQIAKCVLNNILFEGLATSHSILDLFHTVSFSSLKKLWSIHANQLSKLDQFVWGSSDNGKRNTLQFKLDVLDSVLTYRDSLRKAEVEKRKMAERVAREKEAKLQILEAADNVALTEKYAKMTAEEREKERNELLGN